MSERRESRGVEWRCVRESLRFSLRHRRYFAIFLILYWHSLRNWRSARAARYGYCFLQLFDDIMDGDRPTSTPPDTVADQTIAAWTTGEFRRDTSLAKLGAAFSEALQSLPALPGDDPHRDVLVLLQTMRLDGERIATNRVLTRTELKDQLRSTFHHSLNILLIGARLRTRAVQIPDLIESLGWCSVVRDLAEDLERGLVNVPADVVALVRAVGGELTARHPVVQGWLEEEKIAIRQHLSKSSVALAAIGAEEPSAGRLLGLFQRSVERYAR